METYFKLTTTNRKLEAYMNIIVDESELPQFGENELLSFLKENGICFGIIHESISLLINNPAEVQFPLLIAAGEGPTNGKNGYLKNEIKYEQGSVDDDQVLNFREVLKIPSVQNGEYLAKIIPPTNGTNGTDVYGNEITAKPGKPLRLKKGKNIDVIEDSIFAKTDGQVSVNGNYVDVFPVFEVKGDLDLKVGNIDFIGSVSIRGDVPDGYHIKAGGDIKIFGVVEGSTLEAEGSIFVSGGIIGGKFGNISAKGNIQSAYINHAVVSANLDIEVHGAILHSTCSAGGQIICRSGSLIGGNISSGTSIIAKEVGNRAYSKTELFIGNNKDLVVKEKELLHEYETATEDLKKLNTFAVNLTQKYKMNGTLSSQEIELLKKQKILREKLENNAKHLKEELEEIHEQFEEQNNNEIVIQSNIYPNVHINFGKYCLITQHELKRIKYFLDRSEIVSAPL